MKVCQFNLGMGPDILKKQVGETKYALKLFPIGGSCMLGEDDEGSEDPREFRNKPVWQRMIVIAAGAFLNLVLGLLLAIVLSIATPISSLTIADFPTDHTVSNTGESRLREGDEIVSINGMRIISAPEIAYIMENTLMRSGGGEGAESRTVSVFGTNAISNTGEYALESGDVIVSIGGVEVSSATAIYNRIAEVVSESEIAGSVTVELEEVEQGRSDEQGQPIPNEIEVEYVTTEIVVMRYGLPTPTILTESRIPVRQNDDGEREHIRDFFVQAVYEFVVDRWLCAADCDKDYECAQVSRGRRCDGSSERITLPEVAFAAAPNARGGISYVRDFRVWAAEKTIGNVLSYSVRESVGMGRIIWLSLADILRGTYGLNDLSGPVGIGGVVSDAAAHATSLGDMVTMIVQIAAFITINLGIVNLLPIPALDGGRLIFLTLEGIRRKPLNQEVEAMIHFVGFALLMLLIVVVTFNDIRKLAGGG
jgi:regulator of sigma E protease